MPDFFELKTTINRIIVEPATERKTPGGIIVPDKSQELNEGTVMAVGPGARDDNGNRIELEVAVGDYVVWGSKMVGAAIQYNGKKYLAMYDTDVLAIIPQ